MNISRVCLENAYSRPRNYDLGGFDPQIGEVYQQKLPKCTSLYEKRSYDIDRHNQSTGATCARDKDTKNDKERNLTVANWVSTHAMIVAMTSSHGPRKWGPGGACPPPIPQGGIRVIGPCWKMLNQPPVSLLTLAMIENY